LTLWVSERRKKRHVQEESPEQPPEQAQSRATTSIMSMLVSNKLIVAVFSIFYLSYVILFGLALNKWNPDELGHCYRYHLVALPDSSHPHVDKIYLGVTCYYMFSLLVLCVTLAQLDQAAIYSRSQKYSTTETPCGPADVLIYLLLLGFVLAMRLAVVSTALLQFPLHLYMVIALRVSNEKYLEGDSEDAWGFGQVVALILVIPVLRECANGYTGKDSNSPG
jgi:hypothetical protein